MIEFLNFDQALAYRAICPTCNHKLEISHSAASVKSNFENDMLNHVICWEDVGYKLSIDMKTGEVISLQLCEHRNVLPIYSIGVDAPVTYIPCHSQSGMTASGHLMERMIVNCNNCNKYYYTVQVVVKVEQPLTVQLFLNSEFILLQEGEALHEIRNSYSFGITEYNKFIANVSVSMEDTAISFPLIPLDLDNPKKTLDRIKTLVLFS